MMNYWLMKSEPGCFSIDDLQKRPEMTEPWDGVRNFQARNFMRDSMKVGDLAFFYHSNIPQPAVVGIMEVVKAGYPDRTQFNPAEQHFDPKASPDNPVWYLVDVKFLKRMPQEVTLEEIKNNPLLAEMALVNRSRLSVQPVTAQQWRIIMAMGGMAV